MQITLIFCVVLGFLNSAHAAIKIRSINSNGNVKILNAQLATKDVSLEKKVLVRNIPYILSEGPETTKNVFFQEHIVDESIAPQAALNLLNMRSRIPGAQVMTIVNQGPKENRINLTILGDGYTMAEKEKFFADAKRATQGLFTGSTFASYLPLFNVYAVFVPSNTSGIGDGRPKDTAFKLYRTPAGSKRAIMPGNESALEAALRLAPATDYPIVLANDNFYGGLGGRYAISTSSVRSGLIVLRHELGHNFGEVGEEYDGGYVYSGANASRSAQGGWGQWLDPNSKVNDAIHLSGEYVWKNLAQGAFTQNFKFPSTPGAYFLIDISTVGWATPNDVSVYFDNKPLPLQGEFHNDRNFYQIGPIQGFTPGEHTLVFKENVADGDNVLAFSNVYALSPDYDFTPGRIGSYATFDVNGRKSFRPTHNSCLMRNMLTPHFCPIDKENMWHKFLNRMTLIDDVVVSSGLVSLSAPKLNGLEVAWFKIESGAEVELTQFKNQLSWNIPQGLRGNFKARARFVTPEVRKYNKNFLAEKDFAL
ncbi:MAG: hypothetical protein IPM57_05230 [Oligoflexia bacterium]|nr:hypothetical protein [Oligoflexia bacterium]